MKRIGEIKKVEKNNYKSFTVEQLKEVIGTSIDNAHLLYAMTYNDEIIQHCLDIGLATVNSDVMTSFVSYAISKNDTTKLRSFLKRGFIKDSEDTVNMILLLYKGHIKQSDDMVMFLLENDVNVSNFSKERVSTIVKNNPEWLKSLPTHLQVVLSF